MTNNLSPKKSRFQINKINFLALFKKFKFKVIKHFLLTTIKTIFFTILLLPILKNIWEQGEAIRDSNVKKLLPTSKIFGSLWEGLTKKGFIFLGIFLVIIYSIISYLDNLWEEELRIRGGKYVKNTLLKKFRRLTFAEKQLQKDKINALVELDSREVGYYWEHLWNHVYHSVLAIGLLFLSFQEGIGSMAKGEVIFSLFWVLLVNFVSYWFTRLVLENEKKYKERLTEEWAIINKEKNKAILIESMGLTLHYESQQQKITNKNKNLLLSHSVTKSLGKVIPNKFLIEIFPFLLLILSAGFVGKNLVVFWFIFGNLSNIFTCLWDYASYSSSRQRINSFLTLPEKNDNLTGTILNKSLNIKALHCKNLTFSYEGQVQPILKNYTRTFSKGEINYLLGANGEGKSTILYLLLGMLTPQQGQVLVETKEGTIYDLHQELNLQVWREKNVTYCAHDNLVESGSTGQKQWTNIQNSLNKSESQIFFFDEADNALDAEKQVKFQQQLEKLIQKNKIVVYIKHKTLET